MQLPAAKASGPRPKKCWLLTLHPPVSACRMVTCFNPCQCLTLLSDPRKKSRKMQLPAAKASVCLSVCRSLGLSVCRSVGLSVCRSVGLSVCRSVSVGLSVCLCLRRILLRRAPPASGWGQRITLHCSPLHYTPLDYTTPQSNTLRYATRHDTTRHDTTPTTTTPRHTTPHHTTLHYTTLRETTLH